MARTEPLYAPGSLASDLARRDFDLHPRQRKADAAVRAAAKADVATKVGPVDIELAITILAIKKIAEAHFAGGASP